MSYALPKYRVPKIRRPAPVPRSLKQQESPLIGTVGAQPASADEERITRSLGKNSAVNGYIFQWSVYTAQSLPDNEKRVDWLVFSRGRRFPLEFYGKAGHGLNNLQEEHDRRRENELNLAFSKMGVEPLQIIHWWEVGEQLQGAERQFEFDRIIRRMF